MNCWEFKKCGREEGGSKAAELGVCPASTEERVDGANGGRACWPIVGTFCGGKIQGTFAQKVSSCMECDFYQLVGQEEGPNHMSSKSILEMMGRNSHANWDNTPNNTRAPDLDSSEAIEAYFLEAHNINHSKSQKKKKN